MNETGYTLIELLIVISLLALVFALVIPRLSHRGQHPEALAIALANYLNSASSYAAGHETQVCVALQGQNITAFPLKQALTLPTDFQVNLSPYCYDLKGQVATGQTIQITESNSDAHSSVIINPGYGNAQAS